VRFAYLYRLRLSVSSYLLSFLLDPYTYEYFNSSWAINGSPPKQYPGMHTTDITLQKSLGLLDEAVKADSPFFLTVAPIGPHANMHFSDPSVVCLSGLAAAEAILAAFGKPQPQVKYQDAFSNVKVPRTPDFNPDMVSSSYRGPLFETGLCFNHISQALAKVGPFRFQREH